MTEYTETIRRYAMDDRYIGEISPADGIGEVGLGTGEAGRRLAVRFSLSLSDNRIEDIRFKVFGCGFTIAACAAAAALAKGAPVDIARSIDAQKIDVALEGLPSERSYCANLAAEALQAAVASARKDGAVLQTEHQQAEHGPRIAADNPVYRLLMESPGPGDVLDEDRRLFAGLLALCASEPCFLDSAVGQTREMLEQLLAKFFPGISRDALLALSAQVTRRPPQINDDVRTILHSHIPKNAVGEPSEIGLWLAESLAARAAHPGHLWIAMGLFERAELTAAIRRHLPTLAEANNQHMRWKRFLFKQACELNGGMMCKSPDCGDCSDYSLCFVEE